MISVISNDYRDVREFDSGLEKLIRPNYTNKIFSRPQLLPQQKKQQRRPQN